MPPSTILTVFGTRPEAIKLAPVIEALRRAPEAFDVRVCVTGQHREMLDQVLSLFHLEPDLDLGLMQPDQDLTDVAAGVMTRIRDVIRELSPRLVIVQGDTTSAMAAALAAFYANVDVAHVEAGLRSGNVLAPWPEEVNRRVISTVARWHFAPTESARANLLREGVDPAAVHVTGNTVIDALLRVDTSQVSFPYDRFLLVTGHRRENFGEGLESICHALLELAEEIDVVYPVHLNPNVQEPVRRILGAHERVHLIEPVDYAQFVWLMRNATLILSDSGGVQEEAPALGKAVLVMRDTTERPEAVEAGNVKLVGTDRARIVDEARTLLRDAEKLGAMAQVRHPYGDGRAAQRIVEVLRGGPAPRRP